LASKYFPGNSSPAYANLKLWSGMSTAVFFFFGESIGIGNMLLILAITTGIGIASFLAAYWYDQAQNKVGRSLPGAVSS